MADRLWATAGKILTPTVGAVLGGIALHWLFTAAGPRIQGMVEYGPMFYPPPIIAELETANMDLRKEPTLLMSLLADIRTLVASDRLVAVLNRRGLSASCSQDSAFIVSADLLDSLPVTSEAVARFVWLNSYGIPSKYQWLGSSKRWPGGYWQVDVRNLGDDTASSVSIALPHATYAAIEKKGEPARVHEADEVVDLGDLKPTEQVRVTAWTAIRPDEYDAKDIVIRHRSGTGSVRVMIPSAGLWYAIEQYWVPLMLFSLWAAFSTLLALWPNWLFGRR